MIYCNISDCSNWKALDTPIARERPLGYVPLFAEEPFKGTCSLKTTKIQASVARSSSGVKQLIHECVSYNKTDEESSGIVCTESSCLYNTLSDGCDRKKIYVDSQKISKETEETRIAPVCGSFATRKRENAVDWRRMAEGGYGYQSNAPEVSTPSSAASGPRKF